MAIEPRGCLAAAGRCSASAAASAGPAATGGRAAGRPAPPASPDRATPRVTMSRSVCSAVSCACASRQPVQAADHQRRELGAPEVAEARGARAEDRRRVVRDRVLVQRVKEHVLRQVTLGQRALRTRLQDPEPAWLTQLPCQGATSAAASASGSFQPCTRQGRRIARVVAQPAPDVAAGDAEQLVEPRLVVGQPVLHHPRLVRQPVRGEPGGASLVQRRGLRLGSLRRGGRRQQANNTSVSSTPRMSETLGVPERVCTQRVVW